MIDVYTHGSQVGISLHGFGGFLLLLYFTIEMVFLFTTKSLLIHKLFLWFRVSREVRKIIPNWWMVHSVHPMTITKKSTGFEVYIEIKSNIKSNKRLVSDWIICDFWGRIKYQVLIKRIKSEDVEHVEEIKSWKRDKALENIGI